MDPVFKIPAPPSQSLPQDLQQILEMGLAEPEVKRELERAQAHPAAAEQNDVEEMLTEEGELEEGEAEDVDVVAAAAGGEEEVKVAEREAEAADEDGDESGDESDSSSSSSSSASSSSSSDSAASTTSASPATVPSLKQHKKNLLSLSKLAPDEDPDAGGSDAGSDVGDVKAGQDMFRSVNELPQENTAPALPFEQVPFGQQLQELGVVTGAIGKKLVLSQKPSTRWVGQGSGKKEVVVEPEALAEGSVLCWSDGRVLGLVHETFGSVLHPFYTVLLPENFAQPKVMPKEYPVDKPTPSVAVASAEPTPAPSASSPAAVLASGTDSSAVPAQGESITEDMDVLPAAEGSAEAEETVDSSVNLRDDLSEAAVEELVVKGLIRVLSPGPSSPPLTLESVPTSSTDTSPTAPSTSASTYLEPKSETNLTWIPSTKEPVAQFVEPVVGLTPSELVGMTVYFPSQLGKYVPTAQLKRQKWTDASNKFDEEAGEDEMEWSDDEEEMLAKKRRKMARAGSRTPSVRGGSPTPSTTGSLFPNTYIHSDYAPSAAASSYAGSAYGGDGGSDEEGMLDYNDGETDGGEANVPERSMPAAYEDWAAVEGGPSASSAGQMGGPSVRGAARGARGGRGDRAGERGGRGRGAERGAKAGRGGDRESGGRGRGERGRGSRGERGGRGGERGRGRGGARTDDRVNANREYVPAPLPAPPQMPLGMGMMDFQQQQQQGMMYNPQQMMQGMYAGTPPPSARPGPSPGSLSPTSFAIARATGMLSSSSSSASGSNSPAPPASGGVQQHVPYTQQPYQLSAAPLSSQHAIPQRPISAATTSSSSSSGSTYSHQSQPYQQHQPSPFNPGGNGHINPHFQPQPYHPQQPYSPYSPQYQQQQQQQHIPYQQGQGQGAMNPAFHHQPQQDAGADMRRQLEQQAAQHKAELLAMQRQILLLTKGGGGASPAGGAGSVPQAGQGGGYGMPGPPA